MYETLLGGEKPTDTSPVMSRRPFTATTPLRLFCIQPPAWVALQPGIPTLNGNVLSPFPKSVGPETLTFSETRVLVLCSFWLLRWLFMSTWHISLLCSLLRDSTLTT